MPSMPLDAVRPHDEGVALADRAEASLVARAAEGELQAFEQLYRAYHPRLTRFLDRLTRRPALVGELLNDTMLVVWNRAASYNGQSKVSTWIFAIGYRKAMKALSRLDEPLPDEPDDDQPAPPESSPEYHAARSQIREVLAQALDHLSFEQRAIVHLAYFHGIGCREISDIVGCPVDTVKTRMFHARRRLKTLLAGRLEDWL
ncbi:RNA polymerase sigma factor [Variovorax sp. YR216]|uniref:RNA polymerase sigma factor n=1 Tax=Variovorax sp. YR216 TaxID=1882828 RepID=UPI000897DE68|nr:sigma-70 family RNA polymerase sigma factor [Variovorax sp. YR216]SEB13520.1 RNA polymerase sigma-70 factor, ECF subfamily [Variovorax sp. YR216]